MLIWRWANEQVQDELPRDLFEHDEILNHIVTCKDNGLHAAMEEPIMCTPELPILTRDLPMNASVSESGTCGSFVREYTHDTQDQIHGLYQASASL